jgi:NAD(P)-dependent dehydrogenase (short-subunit alcohol dehydrogenase family)
LIFTGATASLRGNKTTSLLSSGKHAIRALSQSLNKEFGKENIHVCEAVIDGYILNDFTREELGEKGNDLDAILTPEVIAKVCLVFVSGIA